MPMLKKTAQSVKQERLLAARPPQSESPVPYVVGLVRMHLHMNRSARFHNGSFPDGTMETSTPCSSASAPPLSMAAAQVLVGTAQSQDDLDIDKLPCEHDVAGIQSEAKGMILPRICSGINLSAAERLASLREAFDERTVVKNILESDDMDLLLEHAFGHLGADWTTLRILDGTDDVPPCFKLRRMDVDVASPPGINSPDLKNGVISPRHSTATHKSPKVPTVTSKTEAGARLKTSKGLLKTFKARFETSKARNNAGAATGRGRIDTAMSIGQVAETPAATITPTSSQNVKGVRITTLQVVPMKPHQSEDIRKSTNIPKPKSRIASLTRSALANKNSHRNASGDSKRMASGTSAIVAIKAPAPIAELSSCCRPRSPKSSFTRTTFHQNAITNKSHFPPSVPTSITLSRCPSSCSSTVPAKHY